MKEHEDKNQFTKGFLRELGELDILDKSSIVYLEEQTVSQSETVKMSSKECNIEGFIFIKDSDGYYECNLTEDCNQVL